MFKGVFTYKDKISPSYVSISNPKYIEIDNIYYTGLIIIDYNKENTDIIFQNIINENINIRMSIFYEKKDTFKAIKDLTYNIANMATSKIETEEVDLVAYTKDDAKYIRREMQINNEELYNLYTYLVIYSDDLNKLFFNLNKVQGILESNGLYTKLANFREDEVFKSTLPIYYNSKLIKNAARRNILTSGIIATYPFILSNIFDEKGIFLGKNIINNSNIFFDRFDKNKYNNSNMCVFGTSGSGKSFFVKLQILRQYLFGIKQFIIDPEREYDILCKNLDGQNIIIGPDSKSYINIFDIRENSIEEKTGYLNSKLLKLKSFFYLIFEDMKIEEYSILEKYIIKTYEKKNINFDDESLFKNINNKENKKNNIENINNKEEKDKIIYFKKEFKKFDDMPILEDLYIEISIGIKSTKNENEKKILNSFKNKLEIFINGSLSFFNKHTNIEIDNNLIVADIYSIGEENYKYAMFLFIELFWDNIKENREEKKIIYIDEIWRIIGVTSNRDVASFIFKIFKTIRKYGGGAVAITQDISDIFSLDDGNYGKSILNNSETKVIFNLEEENIKILSNNITLSEKEKMEIKMFKRGESLLFISNTHILLKVIASDFEKELLEKDYENINSFK